jgi:hypothetical protein
MSVGDACGGKAEPRGEFGGLSVAQVDHTRRTKPREPRREKVRSQHDPLM